MIGELPDLWDFMVGDWPNDSTTARFGEEGQHEQYLRGLKAFTSKPVVGVGRFTSADTMVRMIKSGVLDMIGAARPSIADPFLPRKIEEGRLGGHPRMHRLQRLRRRRLHDTSIRCTQNPTMGEEWRRGWHPERIRAKDSDCARARRRRRPGGARGGDVTRPPRLRGRARRSDRASSADGPQPKHGSPASPPGSGSPTTGSPSCASCRTSRSPEGAPSRQRRSLDYDFDHVAVATGARWRSDGVGRAATSAAADRAGHPRAHARRPDAGHVSRRRARASSTTMTTTTWAGSSRNCWRTGKSVTLVTPGSIVSAWTENTLEQHADPPPAR